MNLEETPGRGEPVREPDRPSPPRPIGEPLPEPPPAEQPPRRPPAEDPPRPGEPGPVREPSSPACLTELRGRLNQPEQIPRCARDDSIWTTDSQLPPSFRGAHAPS